MSIKSVKITNLYGNNYEWHLNPDVNILIGANGTYKSTILQLIKSKLVDKENYPDITLTLEQKPQSYFLITRTNWDVYGLYNVRDNKEFKSFVDKITNTTYISDSYYGVAKRNLSIGEFRLIDLLALAPLDNNKQLILLLNNPENNLSIDWQRNLIEWIRQLNPSCQIIMSTHSPTIANESWIDKVTKIENIKIN
jgi:predicted ATPase